MKQALKYSLKVWLTTSLISPVAITLFQFCYISINLHKQDRDLVSKLLSELPRLALGCAIYMIPLGIGVYWLTRWFLGKQDGVSFMKRKLSIIAIALALLPCALMLSYALSLHLTKFYNYYYTEVLCVNGLTCAALAVACVWFYPIRSESSQLLIDPVKE